MVPSVRSLEAMANIFRGCARAMRGTQQLAIAASASHTTFQQILSAYYFYSRSTPAATDACISALLSLAVAKSRGRFQRVAQTVRRSVRPSV